MHKKSFIRQVVSEDIGRGDLFSFFGRSKETKAYVLAKSSGVFASREYVSVFEELYPIKIIWHIEDGDHFKAGDKLLHITGDSMTLLSLERSILNIILHASGIATLTDTYCKAIEGSGVKLLDTRKTRPLLRIFEKYAVRCGGGINHRMGLDDALMLKDTHLATIDDLGAYADIVMCDNMNIDDMKKVIHYKNANYPHILIEASGNVTLDTIGDIAKCGVDAISTGSIIHQATWVDISMKIDI
ncbi:MAG: nicotinate-nucleotide diphosphorylase [Sulfurovaceae bacterium]